MLSSRYLHKSSFYILEQFDQVSGNLAALCMTIFLIERFIAHGEEQYKLYESNDGGNKCPEKYQIENAQTNLAQIELVTAETAQKESKKCSRNPALAISGNRPEVYRKRLAKLPDAAFWAYFRFGFYDGAALAAKFLINSFGSLLAHDIPLGSCDL
jgi:hypothetical protein